MNFLKSVIICSVCLSSWFNLNANPQIKDSIEPYDYWAKRGIIEMIYAYMEDYVETVDSTKISNKEKIGKEKYKKNFIDKINSITLDSLVIEEIYQFLENNGWQNTNKDLLKPLKEKYNTSFKIDESFFNIKKPSNGKPSTFIEGYDNQNEKWNSKKNEIISNLNEALRRLSNNKQPKEALQINLYQIELLRVLKIKMHLVFGLILNGLYMLS